MIETMPKLRFPASIYGWPCSRSTFCDSQHIWKFPWNNTDVSELPPTDSMLLQIERPGTRKNLCIYISVLCYYPDRTHSMRNIETCFSLSMHWNTARCKLRYHELPSWKNRSVCLRIQDWVKWYFKQSESITFLFNISFQSFAFPSQHHVECVILCFRNVLRRLYLVKCIYLL